VDIRIITTQDGSHSLFRQDVNEHFHSTFGAIQESKHIYIQAGLDAVIKEEIRVFELGYGTGLNALLTCLRGKESGKKICYYSIDKYPVPPEILVKLNYSEILCPETPELYKSMCDSEWEKTLTLGDFTLTKIKSDMLDYVIPFNIDLVYYDAFSPEREPGLWSEALFKKVYDAMNIGGVLVTYCAKGDVRRQLISSGFTVEKLKGPPGKLHILQAVKLS